MSSQSVTSQPTCLIEVWQMGNASCRKSAVPCFRVEPLSDTIHRESECKSYRVPWDDVQREKPAKSDPCCFCWCFFCTCACKTRGRSHVRNEQRSASFEYEKRISFQKRLSSGKLRQWMCDFESLITDEVGKVLFERFLKQEHSDENLKFWLEVEKMKVVQDSAKRYILIQRIYKDFIQPRAMNEINVEAWVRNAVKAKLQDPDVDIFEPAQNQVYLLMYRQSWPRFLASGTFQNLQLHVKS